MGAGSVESVLIAPRFVQGHLVICSTKVGFAAAHLSHRPAAQGRSTTAGVGHERALMKGSFPVVHRSRCSNPCRIFL